jgi:xanthine dehydrogenase YagR molybdenum-binding subunit
VRNKRRDCEEVGMTSRLHRLGAVTTQAELLALIDQLNQDSGVHGILVQLPLPEQIAERAVRTPNYASGGTDRPRRPDLYGGVQFAEVTVDTETGVVRVARVVAVHDCGRPINPLGVVSQVNGGILQGISYALFENRILDRNTGFMVNPNLEQYKILGSRETPEIEVHLIEEYRARSSTDAGGIGEPATIPTAAAVANAVYNATGVRIRELPMTPARVLAALAAAKGGRA